MKKRKFEKGGSVYESAKNFLREKGILDDTPALDEEIALARMRRGEASRSEIPGRGDAIPMVRETMPTSGSASSSESAFTPRPRLSPEVNEAARRRHEAEQAEKKSPGPIAAAGQRAQNIMRVGEERKPGPIAAAGARAQNIMRASSSRRPEEEETTERRKPRKEKDETAPVLFDSGLKSGGVVSRKIDGIAKRGKTRGRIC